MCVSKTVSSSTDLHFKSAAEVARLIQLIQERKISAVETLEQFLARVEKYNPRLNAIIWLDAVVMGTRWSGPQISPSTPAARARSRDHRRFGRGRKRGPSTPFSLRPAKT